MNKILALLLVFLITINSVIAAGDLTVINIVNPTAGNPGASVSGSFNVKNNNPTTTISGITFTKSDLIHSTDPTTKILSSAISFNPASIASLSANTVSAAIVPTVLIPQSIKSGSYTGNMEVRDSTGTHTISFPLTVVVNDLPKLSVDIFTDTNPLIIKEEQGSTATGTFTLKNEGNVVLSNLDISHNIILVDDDKDPITLTFTGLPASLNAGSTVVITAKAVISNNVDFGTYSGTVTIKDLVKNLQSTFKLDIKVEPRVCDDGVRSNSLLGGDNLKLNIRTPKSSDRFAPSEEIELKINVKNNGNRDNDVIVSAFLFDLNEDETLVDGETESITVEDGKDEDFEFTLKIPSDVDTDNKFALFVKAFEEDEEDRNCGEARQDLEIRRERDSVTINKLTLSPSILACSETFDATIDVLNIGTTKEEDVTVRLFDDELKFDLISSPVTLNKFDSSDDKATLRFRDVKIPVNAEQKQYQLEALLSYNNGDKTQSKFGTITVNKCESLNTAINGEPRKVNLQALVSSFTINSGESISIPATITNTDKIQTQYTIELQNAQDFTESVPAPKNLILNPGQSETVYFNLMTKSNLNAGKYTGTLVVKSANNVLDTKAITISAEKASFSGFGNFSNLNVSKVFWIVADIILIIVAIFFIKLIFGKKRKTTE